MIFRCAGEQGDDPQQQVVVNARVSTISMILSVENADSVQTSLGSSGRVRYSCVGLSKSYLVLGATTGSVYLILLMTSDILLCFSFTFE